MNGINRVFIMGYIGAKPEQMTTKKGKTYVRLSIATHFNRKLEGGERESSTTWHRITVWGKRAELCRDRLGPGSVLAVEGYLSRYSYEKEDGTEAYGSSVVAREIHFMGRKGDPLPGAEVDPAAAMAAGFAGAMNAGHMGASLAPVSKSRRAKDEFEHAMTDA